MDRISKALGKIPVKDIPEIIVAFEKIRQRDFGSLNIKKLKGMKDIFRARVGTYRIIFQVKSPSQTLILEVGRRNEKTYRKF